MNDGGGSHLHVGVNETLVQAERLLKERELQERFSRNIKFFKKYDNSIYKKYISYKVKAKGLSFDDNGFINVVQGGQFLYQNDPSHSASKQVLNFEAKPVKCSYFFPSDELQTLKDHFLHYEHLCRVTETIEAQANTENFNNPFQPGYHSFIIFGVGLGYHIQELVRKFDIDQLVIYEHESDMFYFSLYCIDWERVCKRVSGVSFVLGDDTSDFKNNLVRRMNVVGYWRFVNTYFYVHYNHADYVERAKELIADYYSVFRGWGFVDDELISIQHTLANFNKTTAVFKAEGRKIPERLLSIPVMILGNGPSLDRDIDKIKELAPHCIIICCGCSSLKSLSRYGIQPDFITVIERTRGVVEWIEEVEDKTFLSNIRLITINNTHPEVIDAFKQCGLALKPNDCGAEFLKVHFPQTGASELPWCSPNGVNAAVSFLAEVGFKTSYLFGLDLGFRDKTYHHSKKSAYYRESDEREFDKFEHEDDDLVVRKANFGGELFTDYHFDAAREHVEIALLNHPDFSCFNCSDGLYIKGAKPTQPEEVFFEPLIEDKSSVCDEVMELAFPTMDAKNAEWARVGEILQQQFELYIQKVESVAATLRSIISIEVSCVSDVYVLFQKQLSFLNHMRLKGNPDFPLYLLYFGSVSHMHMTISRGFSLLGSDELRMKFWSISRETYIELLIKSSVKIKCNWKGLDTLSLWGDRSVI